MSGHSKFANIKHKKEKNDAAKGKIFTIIGREIAVAVKEGGPDPNNNSRLRDVIAKAKANNMPTALSGGQMQRISIARALVKNPKIILADEPTAALDYDTSIKVLSVIEKISKENSTTILMVTHNPEIAKMANRVVRLRDGKISSIRVNLKPLKATDLVW